MDQTRRARTRAWSRIILLLALALVWVGPSRQATLWAAVPEPETQSQEATIEAWMARMSPAEKVGQLFIVAFSGRNPSPASRAGLLIQQSKIGGVVLVASNHNLVNSDNTPAEVAALSDKLQRMAMGWGLRGRILAHLGKAEAAGEDLQRAFALAEKLNSPSITYPIAFDLGEWYQAAGQERDAAELYGRARAEVERMAAAMEDDRLRSIFMEWAPIQAIYESHARLAGNA